MKCKSLPVTSSRNPQVSPILSLALGTDAKVRADAALALQTVAQNCIAAGADLLEIDLQWRFDNPEMMRFAVQPEQPLPVCVQLSNPTCKLCWPEWDCPQPSWMSLNARTAAAFI